MSQVRGIADLGIFPVLGQPNLNIKVDRERAARYGLNSGDVNTVVQAAMGGRSRPKYWRVSGSSILSSATPRNTATTSMKSATLK